MSAPVEWFFHREGDAIVCRACIVSAEMIGDMVEHVVPGGVCPFAGVTYDDLRAAVAGVVLQPEHGDCSIEPES